MSFDAVLLLSFGGPEGSDDVRPFLENVTRGRGVPPERLDEVAEHYHHFGGVSPINQLNRELIETLEAALARAGIALPVYFGNRNWHPMAEDTVGRMADAGVRRALVFATSAWGGYSGNDQYDEDIIRARRACGDRAPELVKLRQFYDHPLFVEANADAVEAAYRELAIPRARMVFTAHSIPMRADDQLGADGRPNWYSRQVAEASRLVAAAAGIDDYDVVWQSRSGALRVPWLEPDIVEHIEALHTDGVRALVLGPIGFVSDHLEVVWDLDNEAREKVGELGVALARAATPGTTPRFAEMIVELIREHTEGIRPRKLSNLPAAGRSVNGEPVPPESY